MIDIILLKILYLYNIFSAHKKYKKQKNNYLFIVTT